MPAALACTLALLAPPAVAQQTSASPPPDEPPGRRLAASEPQGSAPVSVERIRQHLDQKPAHPLRGLDVQPPLQPEPKPPPEGPPRFRVEIKAPEKTLLEELLETIGSNSGPVPLGGLYGYEQQRLTNPPGRNPLSQPYAAFSGGELITILVENLVGRYFAGRLVNAVTAAERARVEAQAREEVQRAIAAYCAAQPNRADIRICGPPDGP